MENFKAGDYVMLCVDKIEEDEYKRDYAQYREWFPADGTIGIITSLADEGLTAWVQWPRGTTSGDDKWNCSTSWLKKVKNPDFTKHTGQWPYPN